MFGKKIELVYLLYVRQVVKVIKDENDKIKLVGKPKEKKYAIKNKPYSSYTDVYDGSKYYKQNDYALETGSYAIVARPRITLLSKEKAIKKSKELENTLSKKPR